MTKILLPLVFALILTGCSPEGPEPTSRAKISIGALAADFGGDLYFVANHIATDRYLVRSLTASNSTIELPNGQWNMMVFGWTGANQPFEGTIRCAVQRNITLDGTEVSLSFVVNTINCLDSPVANNSERFTTADGQVKPIRFHTCKNFESFIEDPLLLPADYACTAAQAGSQRSFRIQLFDSPLASDNLRERTKAVSSRCYTSGGGLTYVDTQIKVPVGNIGIPMLVESFSGDNCTGTKTTYPFPKALGGVSTKGLIQSSANNYFPNGVSHITVFLNGPLPALTATITRSIAPLQEQYTNSSSIDFDLVFSKPIDPNTFTIEDISNTGSGPTTPTFINNGNNMSFKISYPGAIDGSYIPTIAPGRVSTLSGEENVEGPASESVIKDSLPPAVTISYTGPQLTNTPPLTWTITFTEPIEPNSFNLSSISGAGFNFAIWTLTNSGDNMNYTLTATSFLNSAGTTELFTPFVQGGMVSDLTGNTNNSSNIPQNAYVFKCPDGYIPVPPDSNLGTTHFCVMKYEAKNIGNIATSDPMGTPWVSIDASVALTTCQANGSGYDLISNLEWMAIARNIEGEGSNYQAGVLNRGHSDQNPNLHCDAVVENVQSDCANSGGTTEQKRTHTLSNGEVIWDLAGNAMEWTDWVVEVGTNTFTAGPTNCPTSWVEIVPQIGNCLTADQASPSNTSLTSTEGIGQLLGTAGGYARRGGHKQIGALAGIYSIDFTGNTGNADTGFRCVYRPPVP